MTGQMSLDVTRQFVECGYPCGRSLYSHGANNEEFVLQLVIQAACLMDDLTLYHDHKTPSSCAGYLLPRYPTAAAMCPSKQHFRALIMTADNAPQLRIDKRRLGARLSCPL
jgi:hypothetical protein